MRKEKKIENHNICQSFEMNFPKFDTNQIFQIQKDIFINSNKLNLIDSYISSKNIIMNDNIQSIYKSEIATKTKIEDNNENTIIESSYNKTVSKIESNKNKDLPVREDNSKKTNKISNYSDDSVENFRQNLISIKPPKYNKPYKGHFERASVDSKEDELKYNFDLLNQNKGNDIFTKLKALNKFSYILPTFEEQVIDINNNNYITRKELIPNSISSFKTNNTIPYDKKNKIVFMKDFNIYNKFFHHQTKLLYSNTLINDKNQKKREEKNMFSELVLIKENRNEKLIYPINGLKKENPEENQISKYEEKRGSDFFTKKSKRYQFMLDKIKKGDNLMYYSLLNFNLSSVKTNQNQNHKENNKYVEVFTKQKEIDYFLEMYKNFETNDKKFCILKDKMEKLSRNKKVDEKAILRYLNKEQTIPNHFRSINYDYKDMKIEPSFKSEIEKNQTIFITSNLTHGNQIKNKVFPENDQIRFRANNIDYHKKFNELNIKLDKLNKKKS